MTVRYLFHSGMAIQGEGFTAIIDYFLDECKGERTAQNGVVDDDLLLSPGRFYVFSSHVHGDHFNPVVLSWQNRRKDIRYILSRDIALAGKAQASDAITFVEPGDCYQDECLSVETYGSTDLGVSFVIRAEGKVLFHAGDLNNWHWNREASPDFAAEAERKYLVELERIAEHVHRIDVAMFPIDSRLGPDCGLGAEQLTREIKVNTLIPIHFSVDEREPLRYRDAHPDQHVVPLTARGQTFSF